MQECEKLYLFDADNEDPEPFYGEIPELRGVWATGKALESCRDSLMSALEDWIAFRLRTGRSIKGRRYDSKDCLQRQ